MVTALGRLRIPALDFMLTFEDVELGTSYERQHVMFVFLFLVYFTPYDLFTHLAESINLTEQFVNYSFLTTE